MTTSNHSPSHGSGNQSSTSVSDSAPRTITCFDWQNKSSDYLDGALMGTAKREADEHLETCESCSSHYKHYRLILSSIAGQPRTSLPVALRKSPLSQSSITKTALIKPGFFARLKGWSNVPWYIRIPSEGLSLVLLVTLTISAGPRLRRFYEQKVERSLTEYTEGFENAEEAQAKMARSSVAATAPVSAGSNVATEKVDDFSGGEGDSTSDDEEDDDDTATSANGPQIKVGKAEIWRFNLKTDSPHDLRPRILNLLTSLDVAASTPGIGGIEAPGGIQFDILVSSDVVLQVKQALEKMAPTASKNIQTGTDGDRINPAKTDQEEPASPFGATFTWYKNKSKQPVPAGQTRLVIWLSQI